MAQTLAHIPNMEPEQVSLSAPSVQYVIDGSVEAIRQFRVEDVVNLVMKDGGGNLYICGRCHAYYTCDCAEGPTKNELLGDIADFVEKSLKERLGLSEGELAQVAQVVRLIREDAY